MWWSVRWPDQMPRRHALSLAKAAESGLELTIAHLELAALVLGVGVLIQEEPAIAGKAVLALADNSNAVSWARKAGARDRRAAALVRVLGVMEATARLSLLTNHIPGVDNVLADTASREGPEAVVHYLTSNGLCDDGPWRQVYPPPELKEKVYSILSATI